MTGRTPTRRTPPRRGRRTAAASRAARDGSWSRNRNTSPSPWWRVIALFRRDLGPIFRRNFPGPGNCGWPPTATRSPRARRFGNRDFVYPRSRRTSGRVARPRSGGARLPASRGPPAPGEPRGHCRRCAAVGVGCTLLSTKGRSSRHTLKDHCSRRTGHRSPQFRRSGT
jgi:hypothetical protein